MTKQRETKKRGTASIFNEAVKVVLGNEGILSEHKMDKGLITKYGISLRFYRENVNPEATAENIRQMTKTEATELYKKHFWDFVKGDEIKDKSVAIQIFDIAVNHGVRKAGILVQKTLNYIGGDVVIDGIIGKNTIKAINNSDPKVLNNNLVYTRINEYERIIQRDPQQVVFRAGWINRANKFLT